MEVKENPEGEITYQCEVFPQYSKEHGKQNYENCRLKEQTHKGFFKPVNLFTIEDLPQECRNKDFMEGFRLRCDLTVNVIVNYTSENRPDTHINSNVQYPFQEFRESEAVTRTGTGYILPESIQLPSRGRICPCSQCLHSHKPYTEFLNVSVFCATHVVFDNLEAQSAECECFYDYEDKRNVKRLYGVSVTEPDQLKRCVNDSCVVNCVTHDPELIKKLQSLAKKKGFVALNLSSQTFTKGMIISHPHGYIKHVSMGNILNCRVHRDPRLPIEQPFEFGSNAKYRVKKTRKPCKRDYTGTKTSEKESDVKSTKDIIETSSNSQSLLTGISPNDSPLPTKSDNQPTNYADAYLEQNKSSTYTHDAKPIEIDSDYEYFDLEPETTFKLPPLSNSFCTFPFPLKYSSSSDIWVQFPKGTKFTLANGQELNLPTKSEFSWGKGKATHNRICCLSVVYDIPTCDGCSGAMLFRCDNLWSLFPNFPHSGRLTDGSGCNRSSYILLFCYFDTWMAFPSPLYDSGKN